MAILHSVTILAESPSELSWAIWTETYFAKIYIYELFRKCFLYKLNYDFHFKSRNAGELQKEMRLFEHSYSFSKISYNFLPQLIDKTIEQSLESKAEEELKEDDPEADREVTE